MLGRGQLRRSRGLGAKCESKAGPGHGDVSPTARACVSFASSPDEPTERQCRAGYVRIGRTSPHVALASIEELRSREWRRSADSRPLPTPPIIGVDVLSWPVPMRALRRSWRGMRRCSSGRAFLLAGALLLISGCTSTPSSRVYTQPAERAAVRPPTARERAQMAASVKDLWLYESRRPNTIDEFFRGDRPGFHVDRSIVPGDREIFLFGGRPRHALHETIDDRPDPLFPVCIDRE